MDLVAPSFELFTLAAYVLSTSLTLLTAKHTTPPIIVTPSNIPTSNNNIVFLSFILKLPSLYTAYYSTKL